MNVNTLIDVMPIEILLIEDNPGDVELTKIASEDSKISVNLNIVEDGVEAIAFLRREGKYANVPHPDIVLLDFKSTEKRWQGSFSRN